MDQLKTSLGTANLKSLSELFSKFQQSSGLKITAVMIWGSLAAVALFYLFTCFCLKQICRNAGTPAGLLIWLPVLQMFPLLRAAKMPGWYFLLFLIPLVNIGMTIWWSFRISKACGKGTLVAVLLILPVTTVFAFLYLAFAKSQSESSANEGPVRLDGLANA